MPCSSICALSSDRQSLSPVICLWIVFVGMFSLGLNERASGQNFPLPNDSNHCSGLAANPRSVEEPGESGVAGDLQSLRRDMSAFTERLDAQQREIERQAALIQRYEANAEADNSHHRPAAAFTSSLGDLTSEDKSFEVNWRDSAECPNDCDPLFRLGLQYRVIYNAANFDFHPAVITDDQDDLAFINQRFRTWLMATPNEYVQGYVQVEMGHILWNENLDFPHTYRGPFSSPDDRVGVELRRGYLTYQSDAGGRWRVGIQDWHDAFGESYTLGTDAAVDDYDSFEAVLANSIWDFNVGGLSYVRQFAGAGNVNVNAGIFALYEGDVHNADDAYLAALDLDWPVDDEHSIGCSAYYVNDNGGYSYPTLTYDSAWDVWLGVRAKTMLASIPLRGFAIYNAGQRNELGGLPDDRHDNVAVKLALGAIPLPYGKVSFQSLYSSAGFRTIAQSARDDFGSQGYWSYLLLTSPHGPSDTDDLGVSLQNRGLGLFTAQARYEYPITCNVNGTFAAGWFSSSAANPTSGAKDMGTELAKAVSFDLSGGLTLDLGAAVFFTGDFYKPAPGAPSPDTLWEVFTRAQLEF